MLPTVKNNQRCCKASSEVWPAGRWQSHHWWSGGKKEAKILSQGCTLRENSLMSFRLCDLGRWSPDAIPKGITCWWQHVREEGQSNNALVNSMSNRMLGRSLSSVPGSYRKAGAPSAPLSSWNALEPASPTCHAWLQTLPDFLGSSQHGSCPARLICWLIYEISLYRISTFGDSLQDVLGLECASLITEVLEPGKMLQLAFYYSKSFYNAFTLKIAEHPVPLCMPHKELDGSSPVALFYGSESSGPGLREPRVMQLAQATV